MTQLPTSLSSVEQPSQPFTSPARILIADDDESIRHLLEMALESEGYKVISASNGHELVQMAQEHVPDLLLVDLMMPYLDGFEAIRQLRHDTRTGHLPMLVVTARSRTDDLVQSFHAGADDFIMKPFDINELMARIRGNLARAARQPVKNSLTGLPGNMLLINNLTYHLERNLPFALLYCDLDSFKVFNDTYGFARGDTAIRMLATLLQEAVDQCGVEDSFVGHIGGDDFALLTLPEYAEAVCKRAVALFDERVRSLYEQDDIQRGYLSGLDRHGILRRFPLMTLSIGVVSTLQRTFASHEEVSQAAAEMKHVAKSRPGSTYALDKRSRESNSITYERRGGRSHAIILVSNDHTLLHVLRQVLNERGYRVSEASTPLAANAQLARTKRPLLVIADAQLGEELSELCANRTPHQLLLIIAGSEDHTALCNTNSNAMLHQPFAVDELVARVEQLFIKANEDAQKLLKM